MCPKDSVDGVQRRATLELNRESHRLATLRALSTALFQRERIQTTLMKAKDLRSFAEKIITLASLIEMVYSPTVDMKQFPENVDVCLVEGAASSDEDIHKLKIIRKNSKCVVALGDCAVTGNVPSMRNSLKIEEIYDRAYFEGLLAGSHFHESVAGRFSAVLMPDNMSPRHQSVCAEEVAELAVRHARGETTDIQDAFSHGGALYFP